MNFFCFRRIGGKVRMGDSVWPFALIRDQSLFSGGGEHANQVS